MNPGEQAQRFIKDGKVRELPKAKVFVVEADADDYLVTIASYRAMCSCPSFRPCSHIDAARWTKEATHG